METKYISIRDDDICYFTKPKELETAYDFLDEKCKIVSLSVVPFSFPYHKKSNPYGVDVEAKYYDIADNEELVEYLKTNLQSGKYEIMLHGFSHEYKMVGDKWLPEMLWKDKKQIKDDLTNGKKHLEELFHCNIKIFVAPNNLISAKGIDVIEDLKMDFSGTIWKKPDRKIDRYYIHNYIHRVYYSLSHGIPYSGKYNYSKHRELYAHKLRDDQYIEKVYNDCIDNGYNIVFYTHYWELNSDPKQKEMLKKLCKKAMSDGFEMVSMSKCFM